MTTPTVYANTMTDQQRALYYAQMSAVQRDEVVGVLLAVFLGIFGAHHFYLRKTGLGITYLVLSFTGIPMLLGWIEAFFMPGRVRRFNAEQAAWIAANIQGWVPPIPVIPPIPVPPQGYVPVQGFAPVQQPSSTVICRSCGASVVAGVNFCSRCGSSVSADATSLASLPGTAAQ
jgi:TM2 domain-containing membrane protein YozV